MANVGSLSNSTVWNGVSQSNFPLRGGIVKVVLNWTSDASGNVTQPTTFVITGQILEFALVAGSPAPSGSWSVTLKDPYGLDVLGGLGASVGPNTGATAVINDPAYICSDVLILGITGGGNAKQGQVVLFLKN